MLRRVFVITAASVLLLVGCAPDTDPTQLLAATTPEPAPARALPAIGFADQGPANIGPFLAPNAPAAPAPGVPARSRRQALIASTDQALLRTWRHPGPSASVDDRLATSNAFGQQMSFLVQERWRDRSGTGWLRIRTGEYPNGDEAWVLARDVRLASVTQRIVVDLSERRLLRTVNGRVRTKVMVAIGQPSTPTVPGRYFVWARVRYPLPRGPYGALALGLSGFSEVVRFGPAPGRLAIHGTDDPSDRGRAVSLGCVRVYNAQIERLWNVPMGTPVIIRP